ncbi:class I SAM-dependent methyltransferase [Nocardia sp. Marseille-Q1738]
MQDLSYTEKSDRLATRIRAHKKFANYDIEEWIGTFLAGRARQDIFDIGCGSGNHLHLYLDCVESRGTVAGLDREAGLIDEARRRYPDATNLDLRVGSMDTSLPFPDSSFDTCFSNFAIYNATDPAFTLRELRRVLRSGGEVVMIGPTINNAKELYAFNERLTGKAIDEVTLIRTDRLRREIVPLARDVFAEVYEEVINAQLEFPSAEEFLRYYTATMLYEEGAEKEGRTAAEMQAALSGDAPFILSKEMLAVIAR